MTHGRVQAERCRTRSALFRLAMWSNGIWAEAEGSGSGDDDAGVAVVHRFQPGTNCRAWLNSILQHVRSNRRRARHRAPLADEPFEHVGRTLAFVPPGPTS